MLEEEQRVSLSAIQRWLQLSAELADDENPSSQEEGQERSEPSPLPPTVAKNPYDNLIWPPPPRPRVSQGPPAPVKVLLAVLAALLVLGGLGFVVYAATDQYGQALQVDGNAALRQQIYQQATSGAGAIATARVLATAQAGIYATATAQAASTADTGDTSSDQVASQMAALLAQDTSGTPDLDDPLSDNTLDNQWAVGYTDNNGTGCNFVDGSYEAQEALAGYLNPCFAEATNFDNFVYQISLSMGAGTQGGILFRGDKDAGTYYLFRISPEGTYALDLYNGDQNYTLLTSGISPAIIQGADMPNQLSVIADKDSLYLFVNQTFVAVVNDTTLSAGQIGVAVINNGLPGIVTFSNAQVWKQS